MYEPIAYTYEADYHCPYCTERRFGRCENGDIACNYAVGEDGDWHEPAEDSESNSVGAVTPWNEWWQDSAECESLNCSDCHAELDTAHREDCEENDGEETCDLVRV